MKKLPYLSVVAAFCAAAAVLFLICFVRLNAAGSDDGIRDAVGNEIVALNRAEQLAEKLADRPGDVSLRNRLKEQLVLINPSALAVGRGGENPIAAAKGAAAAAFGLFVAFAAVLYTLLWKNILRPFGRLEAFASRIAAGELDIPLGMERGKFFADFMWAFDLMRTELKKARAAEREANLARKTLVATISHDIKTPVASIRAYAEALSLGTASTPERREKYLAVIQRKADEVANLTDDLFLHAVSDIDKLTITIRNYEAPALFREILEPFREQYGQKIVLKNEPPEAAVVTDARRLSQTIGNIVANADKYAGDSPLEISFSSEDGFVVCRFEDFGGGIPPEDMPFVRQKFYRGKNAGNFQGAGLGLYICDYILHKTGGFLSLENTVRGLVTKIGVKICET